MAQVTRVGYFVDGDAAHEQVVTVSDGSATAAVSLDGLTSGMHALCVRAGDATRWGPQATRFFIVPSTSGRHIGATTCRYWIDADVNNARTAAIADGLAMLDIDVSALSEGMHSLCAQVGDGTAWGPQQSAFFLIPSASGLTDGTPRQYRYWIDDDEEHMVTGNLDAGGMVTLDIDVSALREGAHRLHSQVRANIENVWSPVCTNLFVITGNEARSRLMTGYDYWFNSGDVRHVDIAPSADPLTLTAITVAIDDVVPNALDNYTFDVSTLLVTAVDDVTFGFQVVNGADKGMPHLTLLDDYAVTLDPRMVLLKHKQHYSGDVPRRGAMRGFMVDSVSPGANVTFSIGASGVAVDLFDAEGKKLAVSIEDGGDGMTVHRVRPTVKGAVYALVYNVTEPVSALDVMWRVTAFCDVNDDGRVDVGDVNTVLSDILLGGTTMDYDVNGDGRVDVGDVNTILTTILKG